MRNIKPRNVPPSCASLFMKGSNSNKKQLSLSGKTESERKGASDKGATAPEAAPNSMEPDAVLEGTKKVETAEGDAPQNSETVQEHDSVIPSFMRD